MKNVYSQTNSYYYLQNASYDEAGRMDLLNLGAADLVSNPVLLRDYSYFAWDAANGLGRLMGLKTGTPANPTSLQDLRYYTGPEDSPTP